MRLPLITAALLASLALPFAAIADDEEDEEDAFAQMMMSTDGIPQADMGEEDNGWYFTRERGACRMYSFNDPLVLQADPADPTNSTMRFQLIDGSIPEKDGAQVEMLMAIRDKPDGDFAAFPATLTVSQAMPATYVLAVPMKNLATKFPNGFQVVLADASSEKPIVRADTLGSRKHLAALAQCEQG